MVRAKRSMKSAGKDWNLAHCAQYAINPQDRVVAGAQVDIRGLVAHGHGQNLAKQLERIGGGSDRGAGRGGRRGRCIRGIVHTRTSLVHARVHANLCAQTGKKMPGIDPPDICPAWDCYFVP